MIKLIKRKKKEITIHHVLPNCLNCGKPLASDDVFCSYCGQKNVEKLSFGNFTSQIVSGMFSYDSRFWTTIIPLLFKPGKVSKDYIEGKRKRYVNPFQMYLHVSIIFFILLGWGNRSVLENFIQDDNTNEITLDSIISEAKNELLNNTEIDSTDLKKNDEIIDNSIIVSKNLDNSTYNIDSKKDSISFNNKLQDFIVFSRKNPSIDKPKQALDSLGYPNTFWNSFFYKQANKIRKILNGDYIKTNWKGLFKTFMSYMSIGLFIFLPLFALSLKVFYYRKRMNYMEHLVFVFHTQTVFFLLLIISTIIGLISNYENSGIFMLLFLIYLYLSLRKFYNQGHFKTFIKFLLLNFVYLNIGMFAVIIISIIAFLFD